MRTVRRALSLCLLALAGCGGGGGGGGAPGGGTQPDPLEATALSILRDCAPDAVADHLEILGAFHDILDVGASAPPVLNFTSLAGSTVSWTLDLDGDGTDDFAGSVHFTNATGTPITPFDLSLLLANTQRLVTYLVNVPVGSRLIVQVASAGVGNKNAQLTGVVGTGVVTSLSGSMTSATATCSGTASFPDTPVAALGGVFPMVDLGVSFSSSEGIVVGSLAIDGTNTSVLMVRLNGAGDLFEFTLNLFTGDVATT